MKRMALVDFDMVDGFTAAEFPDLLSAGRVAADEEADREARAAFAKPKPAKAEKASA